MIIKPTKQLLLCLPIVLLGIIGLHRANAFWHGSGSGAIMGQIKPTGVPTYVGDAEFPGILFYGFDTGQGAYTTVKDVPSSPFHLFDPPNSIRGSPCYDNGTPCSPATPYDPIAPSFGSTAYGTAFQYPGSLIIPGIGSFVGPVGAFDFPDTGPGGSTLRDAINLQAASTGAVFTMFATFMITLNTPSGSVPLIFGRGWILDTPTYVHALTLEPTTNKLNFVWATSNTSGGSSGSIQSSSGVSLNAIHTAVAYCVNTAPGVTTVRLFLDGTEVATPMTGQSLFDVQSSNTGLEDQLQVGTAFHVYAGQSDAGIIGSVYQVGIANAAWSMPTAAADLATNPYKMLLPP